MDPYIESFAKKVQFHRYRFFKGSKRKIMTHHKCIKNFMVCRGTGLGRGKINLGTLDVLELQGRLQGKEEEVNRRLVDRKITTINERNEFRSFFAFLKKEYPGAYQGIPFIKSERPDFVLRYNREVMGIEITEAIDGSDAKRRAKIDENHLRGGNALREKPTVSIEKLIDRRVGDKKRKFKDFQQVDREILVILANHREFESPGDVEKLRRFLEEKGSLEQAPFSLVVVNLIQDLYAHYRWHRGKVVLNREKGREK